MKTTTIIAALAALVLTATAAQAAPNPFYDAYQNDITVTDVTVTYADDIVRGHSDSAAESFVEDDFSPELRTAFEALAAPRGLSDESYGERVSEFLVTRSIQSQSADLTGARRVKIVVLVTDARIPGMSAALMGGSPFPRLDCTVQIVDADTDALLATANITNSQSWANHADSASQRHGFRYNMSGTDTNFRLLAGSTEALAGNIRLLLSSAQFSTERVSVGGAARIALRPPVFEVTLAPQ